MTDRVLSIISATVGLLEAIAVLVWAGSAVPAPINGLEVIGIVVLVVAVIFQFANLLREIAND